MSFAGDILRAKRQQLMGEVAEIRRSIRELDAALEVLGEAELGKNGGAASASPINAAIVDAISQGNSTPAQIFEFVTTQKDIDTSKNSISTRLSKMKNDGLIDHDGHGWVLLKTEGSDASTSKPSSNMGPATGRGKGFPSNTPEGSIPSGSTTSHDLADLLEDKSPRRPLDDEIPF